MGRKKARNCLKNDAVELAQRVFAGQFWDNLSIRKKNDNITKCRKNVNSRVQSAVKRESQR